MLGGVIGKGVVVAIFVVFVVAKLWLKGTGIHVKLADMNEEGVALKMLAEKYLFRVVLCFCRCFISVITRSHIGSTCHSCHPFETTQWCAVLENVSVAN